MMGPELIQLLPRLRRFSIALMGRAAGDRMLLACLTGLRKARDGPLGPDPHLPVFKALVERYLADVEGRLTSEDVALSRVRAEADGLGTTWPDNPELALKAMERALQKYLRPEERVAVLLKDLEDLPYVEVASIMGRSVAQVRSLHFSGRDALLSYLSDARAKGA